MDWKKAGIILATVGVTATVGYVSYTYITSAKTDSINKFFDDNKDTNFVKELSEEDKLKAIKKRTNISSKNLVKIGELINKKDLTDSEQKELNKLINKWGFLNKKK